MATIGQQVIEFYGFFMPATIDLLRDKYVAVFESIIKSKLKEKLKNAQKI